LFRIKTREPLWPKPQCDSDKLFQWFVREKNSPPRSSLAIQLKLSVRNEELYAKTVHQGVPPSGDDQFERNHLVPPLHNPAAGKPIEKGALLSPWGA
jgi:hypothetical protein